MASSGSGAPEQACPSCERVVSTAGLEPFAKLSCPGCGFQLRVERVFENYEIVEPLGAGGMGSVFKARDRRLHRFVALKILREEFAGDESLGAKLQEEARITASIHHPHVLEVFSVGHDHGQFYVVMELVDGGSLDARMEDERRISELRALDVGLQVAQGLQAALRAGLIHRDIKPGNILFTDAGTAKIVDFGLALLAEQHAGAEGEIWGTPYYVAPERLTSEPEDFRSDLYSLGATLFHAVAGRPTFEDETQSAAELNKLKANPPRLKSVAPDVSGETCAVIDRMLRPNPAERQASYNELIGELQAARSALLAREEEVRGRSNWPVRILVSLGGLLILGTIGFGLLHRPQSLRETSSSPEATTPAAVNLQTRITSARRELQVGHYSAAEALFRQIASSAPNVWSMVDLCAGLQLWEHGDFAQAAAVFRRFSELRAPAQFAWMNDARPLAQNRLDDYALYEQWVKARGASKDPERLLKEIRATSSKLKTKDALSFQLADEEAKIVAQLAARMDKRDKRRVAEEMPRWKAALASASKADVAYRFGNAIAALEKVRLTAPPLRAERDDELQRTRWLAAWKTKLISDINGIGFGGTVTDIHGVRYDGRVRRATSRKIELETHHGSVLSGWTNLSPKMLLKMSTAFIRPSVSDVPERQWLSAIFAAQTGQKESAQEFAQKAAAAKQEFHDLLARFFPDATR
ncbi:MAG: serine/threonine protein kinase [Chthoniobacterales bacterium]|nr:serine/threonine protein kinase [Chthoniobacterales bacterium]